MDMVLSGLIIVTVTGFALWQWAMMFTDGFCKAQENNSEAVTLLIVVVRSAAVVLLPLASLFLPELLGII